MSHRRCDICDKPKVMGVAQCRCFDCPVCGRKWRGFGLPFERSPCIEDHTPAEHGAAAANRAMDNAFKKVGWRNMKLDRNINPTGMGKYALLKLRNVEMTSEIVAAFKLLEDRGILDWGDKPETEFFVIRLKDRYAYGGLAGYAEAAKSNGQFEWANEVRAMADRAGKNHPNCQEPD